MFSQWAKLGARCVWAAALVSVVCTVTQVWGAEGALHRLTAVGIFGGAGTVVAWFATKLRAQNRKLAEESAALREYKEKFQTLSEVIPQRIWTCDVAGRVDYASGDVLSQSATIEHLSGLGWLAGAHEEDALRSQEEFRRCAATGTRYESEVRFFSEQYQMHRWYLVKVVPIRNAEGSIVKWMGSSTDIHDQKTAQQNLKSAHDRFRRLADANIVGIVVSSIKGDILEANEYFFRLTGYSQDDVKAGLNWREITAPDCLDRDEEAIRICKTTGVVGPWEKEYLRKDGSRMHAMVGYARLEGQQTGVAIILDMTKQKELEKILRKQSDELALKSKQLQWWFDNSSAALALFEPGEPFRLLARNTEFQTLIPEPFHDTDLIGKPVREFVSFYAEKIVQLLRQVSERGATMSGEHALYYLKGRGTTWWNWRLSPIIQGDTFAGIAFVAVEVTQEIERTQAMQSAKEQAEHASHMKDEFFAVLSHELRTPLNGIVGWTSLLLEEVLENEKVAVGLKRIEGAAESLANLVEEMFDVSRIVSGKFTIEMEDVELVSLVHGVVNNLRFGAEAKQVQLDFAPSLEAIGLRADGKRLQQVIANLLSNALKFTECGGVIRIQLECTESDVVLSVKDTGIGMDADLLPYVFERFHQGDSSLTRKYSGLGLGLAIVKHIVELHGGCVTAASEGPGKGSTFTVALPMRELAKQAHFFV